MQTANYLLLDFQAAFEQQIFSHRPSLFLLICNLKELLYSQDNAFVLRFIARKIYEKIYGKKNDFAH